MADFTSEMSEQDMPEKVTKAYMICPVSDIEINETTALHIANDRLRMDYARSYDIRRTAGKFKLLYTSLVQNE